MIPPPGGHRLIMALLDLFPIDNFYFELAFAVFSFAANKNTGTISVLAVLFRHFILTKGAFNLYFFNFKHLQVGKK